MSNFLESGQAHTANQFPLTAGFTLNVTFTTAATGFPSFTSNFGIVDEVTSATPDDSGVGNAGNINAYLFTDQESLNTVGFSAANRPEHTTGTDPGLYTDFGALASVSTALNDAIILGTTQTFSLTVNADGSATFSLDDTSGDLAAGTLSSLFTDSADGEYHFVAYSQGNTGLTLNSVSIDAVPVVSTSLTITEIQYSPEADTVTLTWVSSQDSSYVARFSNDLIDWDADLDDGITMAEDDENLDDGNLLTKTFNLEESLIADATKLFFQIEIESE